MDRHQDVTALLAYRLKPLSRVAPRDSFASDSYSLEDSSPVPLKYAEDDDDDRRSTSRRPSHHPFSAQTHVASEDEDSYVEEEVDVPQESQLRMSVMGPKIHKNGNAPWEEMDGLAEEPEDYDRPTTPATSIFGKRSKHARKGSTSTTSGLRQRSKTVVEALSPVGALKGLGFAVGGSSSAGSSAPSSSRTSRNNSLAPSMSKQPRPSFQSQYSTSSANSGFNDDDKRSVNTVVDGYNQYPTARQRSRSRPRQETTYADGTIPIDLTGRNSSISTSSSSFSEDESSRPPLPRTSKNPLRIATDVHNSSHHHSHTDSIVRPEDVFRTSIVSTNSEYGQRLHPYSNVDARTASTSPTSPKAPSGFSSDWASSPSPLEPSRSPAGTGNDSPSHDNWLDSPSGYGRSAASSFFDRSRNNATTPLSNKANNNRSTASSSSSSRKKPPPLTLHPSTSSTSISTLAKGGNGGLIPPPLPITPVSPSTAGGITRSPTPNSEALYRSEDVATTKPLNISRKPVPQHHQNDSSDYFPGGASLPTRSTNHPSAMASTTESCLPFPSTPQQHQQHVDVPPGMLVFPGSPAYGLISLEQAQAKIRSGSGPAGRSLSGDVKGRKEGLGGFVARMRLGSEDKAGAAAAATTSGGSVEGSIPPLIGSTGSVSHQENNNSAKTPGSSTTTQTSATTTTARQPVLRQRKSGFLKIFGGGDKTPAAPPMPASPIPRSGATMISSPMPLGMTDDGLPSPFLPGEGPTRKPMALREIVGRHGSVSGPSPVLPSRESNPSWSPPASFQSRPSVAAQGTSSVTPSSKSFSRLKETGLIVYGGSPNLGDEDTGSRGRSGTTSTVHCPQYDLGPKDESVRSDLSTMGGGEDDATEERKALLKLRHVSATNFLSTLPSGYLAQPYPGATTTSSSTSSSTLNNSIPFSSTCSEYQFSTSSSSASRPSVSASSDGKSPSATPSFNSLLSSSSSNWVSSSSVYASSESSSSIAPSPLPVTPHSGGTGTMAHQQQMSMMSLVSPTPTQSSFLSSPGRTPQQQPFVDIRGGAGGADGGIVSMSSMITSVQEELAATRKQMRQQALEMERMKSELEALRKEKEEMKMMGCRSCGGRDVAPRSNSSESAGEPAEKRAAGVVNRPRAPTGSGGRFGNRMI